MRLIATLSERLFATPDCRCGPLDRSISDELASLRHRHDIDRLSRTERDTQR